MEGAKPPYEKTFNGDTEYGDFKVADSVASAILSNTIPPDPFSMWPDFQKPHLVFASPEKYWDMYNEDEITLPVPKNLARVHPNLQWTGIT